MPRWHWETKEGYTVDPAESTLVNVYMRKNVVLLPEPMASNSARACSACVALTELTRVGEKTARPEGWPYHGKTSSLANSLFLM